MNKFNTNVYGDKKILIGFVLTISITFLLCIYFYLRTQQLVNITRNQVHATQVIAASQHLLSAVVDMETSQRGFIITADESYLEPYRHANDTIDMLVSNLRDLVREDSSQLSRLRRLQSRIDEKSSWVETVNQARRVNFEQAQLLVLSGYGKDLMDQIREDILTIQNNQQDAQSTHSLKQTDIRELQSSFLGLLFVLVIMISFLFYYINKNLNARALSERKLKEAMIEIQDLYDKAPCGYLSVDESITLTNINQTLLSWLGYSREEVIGKMKYSDLLNPESQHKFLAGFEEDFAEYQKKGYVSGLEFQFQRKDGSSFDVIVNSMATFDIHGKFVKSRTTVFDNTERKKTERELILATERIHDLYNYAPCGYHSLDEHANILEINQTELNWLGYTLDELKGKRKFTEFITPESLQVFKDTFPEFKRKGVISDLEFEMVRKDGSTFPVVISATTVLDHKGNFLRSRSTVFDNTARKAAEEKARLLAKELEAFSYSVSHDLRAPLRSIDSYARILEEDYDDKLDTEAKRVINIITRNANRMGQLIDDLLDFSKMGRKDLMKASVDMDKLINEILESQIPAVHQKIELKLDSLGLARADMSMMKQVWINLISNAIKYSNKKEVSRIEIGKRYFDTETHFYIKDNGVGFDMRYANKLFEVFQRLHKVQEFEGTGVGLALVKRIVTRHGGKVWAEAAFNQGATFYFSLPNN